MVRARALHQFQLSPSVSQHIVALSYSVTPACENQTFVIKVAQCRTHATATQRFSFLVNWNDSIVFWKLPKLIKLIIILLIDASVSNLHGYPVAIGLWTFELLSLHRGQIDFEDSFVQTSTVRPSEIGVPKQVDSCIDSTDCNIVCKLVSLLKCDPFVFGKKEEHVSADSVVSPNHPAMPLARC